MAKGSTLISLYISCFGSSNCVSECPSSSSNSCDIDQCGLIVIEVCLSLIIVQQIVVL